MKRICQGQFVVEWVAKQTNEFGNFGCATGIGLQEYTQFNRWRIVAGVAYAEWNGVNVVCHIASEGKTWATREFLGVIFDYPFNRIGGDYGAKRITVCVGEGNADSRKFVEHLGFTREANLTGAHPTGDLLIYKMDRSDCRFLRKPYALTRPDPLLAAA